MLPVAFLVSAQMKLPGEKVGRNLLVHPLSIPNDFFGFTIPLFRKYWQNVSKYQMVQTPLRIQCLKQPYVSVVRYSSYV